jgi:hypothetical protein
LYAHAEDILKLLNYHGHNLKFSGLEIQKQSAIEESEEGAEPGLSVRRSTMMVLRSSEGLRLIEADMKVSEDIDLKEQRPSTTRQGVMRKFAY